ncbi:MAG: Arm DNA-binding domain-containing protein [Rhodanobacter sp.]
MFPTKLRDAAIQGFQPSTKHVKHSDGGGRYLEVSPAGGKLWRLKYRHSGKEKRLALGKYPAVGLTNVRARRDELRALLSAGVDPSGQVKAEHAEQLRHLSAQTAGARFCLNNDGALSIRLGNRCVALTPKETADLRAFMDATAGVACKD